MKGILFSILFLLHYFSPAGISVDSLQRIIKSAGHDSTIINTWKAWDNLIYMSDPELDFKLSRMIDSLCFKNLKSGLTKKERIYYLNNDGFALNNMTLYYQSRGEYKKSNECAELSLKCRKAAKHKKGIATCYHNLATNHQYLGNYDI